MDYGLLKADCTFLFSDLYKGKKEEKEKAGVEKKHSEEKLKTEKQIPYQIHFNKNLSVQQQRRGSYKTKATFKHVHDI